MTPIAKILIAFAVAGMAQTSSAQGSCPDFGLTNQNTGGLGASDYRYFPDKGLVERAHFTPEVENLTRGKSGTVAGDIAYTLNVFPNHPRALLAAQRLAEKEKTDIPAGLKFTTQCYYERAVQFRPDDHPVRLLYAMFLIKAQQTDLARKHIEYVDSKTQEAPFTQYNVGLLYMDLGDNEKALAAALRAYELGATNPRLKERLEAAGHWQPAAAASATTP